LLRRIPPWHEPVPVERSDAGAAVGFRPPSAAFTLDPSEAGLSFHLESSLRDNGEQLSYGCPIGQPGWAVTRITAASVRELGLWIERDDKPHHVQVFGLREFKGNALRRKQKELALRSVYIIPPMVG
jgi:hypothetical protein